MIVRYRVGTPEGDWCYWSDAKKEFESYRAEIARLEALVDDKISEIKRIAGIFQSDQKEIALLEAEVKRVKQLLNQKPFSHSTCPKSQHSGDGYLHGPNDDLPYQVDGLTYCGRCHSWIPEEENHA